jgi:iron(III) transport system ATP-binding protein
MKVLQVEGLSKQMGDGYVVKQISFAVAKGEKIGIAGQTGSGKSSLLKMIAGLMQPDEGRVVFQQKRVEGPDEKLIAGHPQIGYLSQHFELRNNYHVHELLEMSNRMKPLQTFIKSATLNLFYIVGRMSSRVARNNALPLQKYWWHNQVCCC